MLTMFYLAEKPHGGFRFETQQEYERCIQWLADIGHDAASRGTAHALLDIADRNRLEFNGTTIASIVMPGTGKSYLVGLAWVDPAIVRSDFERKVVAEIAREQAEIANSHLSHDSLALFDGG